MTGPLGSAALGLTAALAVTLLHATLLGYWRYGAGIFKRGGAAAAMRAARSETCSPARELAEVSSAFLLMAAAAAASGSAFGSAAWAMAGAGPMMLLCANDIRKCGIEILAIIRVHDHPAKPSAE